ncbi:hypothetical protein I203_106168 [Kwoniella mangroviensis CBS 8507]|uniref:uncharacterized protein n=1 Tax=Kwoniella mangroviensis CBS 8507 TaxID=1296122 RepID=UPI00080D69B2|nr:uncharacterized protein I203_04644 [Kwoniella mangroviensis CBS 8507]OCF66313.1 hypothetical protein I203_04644 [Kwoniella mangroviensis CBS 8507]
MPPRATKRARPSSPSPSPDPIVAEQIDDEPSASHLVSFLTGYADHHSSASSSGDEGFDAPSDDNDDDDVDVDEEDDLDGTPTKRAKTGLIGTSTPTKKGTPRKRTGSKTPGGGNTPKKTPNKRKLDPLEILEKTEEEGIIRVSKSDRYLAYQSRTSRTSGNSYSSLVKPLSQKQYDTYTASSSAAREEIRPPEQFEERYDQWEMELEEGFNLIFYGFGSKRNTINRFVEKRLSKRGEVVVVNGHFPQMGIREILNSIEDNLSVPQNIKLRSSIINNSSTIERSAHRIYSYFLPPNSIPQAKKKDYPISKNDLYLIIHNLDSTSLRKPISLSVLSLLASSPRIHLIASFDHLRTPLLFSPSLTNTPPHVYGDGSWTGEIPIQRGFNWLYHNLTTYAPYTTELSYLKLSASTHLSLSSSSSTSGISEEGALQILKSVPPMAARLLKLLLTKQLSNLPPEPTHHIAYPPNQVSPIFAVDNDILQSLAKEKFIAREEERYDALIGEYRDHGLVVEASLDGEGRTGRWVWVPLGKAAIERVLETMKEVEV